MKGATQGDNRAVSPPPLHQSIAADAFTPPAPFRAFAVRSDEPAHAWDARAPYARVHAVRAGLVEDAAIAALAAAGYPRVDIEETFAVDYAPTGWSELAAIVGEDGLPQRLAAALRHTRVLGDDPAPYARCVASRVDFLASRGAGFHNDVGRHWSRCLFWILALDLRDVEFVMPHAGVRLPLAVGDLLVFDQTMAHGLCRPADRGRAVAASFEHGEGDRQLFLTGEIELPDERWAALGSPWLPVEAHAARGALDLMVAEFDDRSGAVKRPGSLRDGLSRAVCHVDAAAALNPGAASESEWRDVPER